MRKEIHVPDIGDFKGVDVIEVLVSSGDHIQADDPMIMLESDKASMEVPAPVEGIVQEVRLKVGDKISEGDLILVLETDETSVSEEDSPATPAPELHQPVLSAALQEVRVPDIGDFKGVDIIAVSVVPGDQVAAEDTLITLESDKASMDVPSPFSGQVKEIGVKVGDKVSEGDLILWLEVPQEQAIGRDSATSSEKIKEAFTATAVALGPKAPKPETATPPRPPMEPVERPIDEDNFARVHASRSVRRFARELGVDLGRIGEGSGRKGRILKDDVQGFVKQALQRLGTGPAAEPVVGSGIPPIPAVDFAKFGEIETQPLTKIKRLTGINLSRSWLNLPHVTHHDEADITELEAFRQSLSEEAKQRDLRITLLGFLLKASAATLQEYPVFNASLDPSGENLILKKYFHIGVAVDTPDGLVVPVIRDVGQKSIFQLSAELAELSAKARQKKLSPGEMQGACFTISSLGGIGGTTFTPIVNAPEVAILGVTRSKMQPVWNGQEFLPRLMLPLSLSYDHRVIDGAQAARFVAHLGRLLTDVRRLLL